MDKFATMPPCTEEITARASGITMNDIGFADQDAKSTAGMSKSELQDGYQTHSMEVELDTVVMRQPI